MVIQCFVGDKLKRKREKAWFCPWPFMISKTAKCVNKARNWKTDFKTNKSPTPATTATNPKVMVKYCLPFVVTRLYATHHIVTTAAELRHKGLALSLARRAIERGHLLYSAFTRPPDGNARRLESRHPLAPATQQLSLSDNNRSAVLQADHRWNAEWLENTRRLCTFIPDTGTTLPEWPCQEQRGSGLTASSPVLGVSALLTQMGYALLRPVRVAQSRPLTMLFFTVQSIDPPWSGWPDGSGWRNNRMAAQHLARDPVQPNNGLKELARTTKKTEAASIATRMHSDQVRWSTWPPPTEELCTKWMNWNRQQIREIKAKIYFQVQIVAKPTHFPSEKKKNTDSVILR